MRPTFRAPAALTVCAFVALWLGASGPLPAQQTTPVPTAVPAGGLVLTITKEGGQRLPLAVPPLLAPGMAALQSKVIDPFTATLRSDLDYAQVFTVVDSGLYPSGFREPNTQQAADRWLGTGAEVLVDTRGEVAGDRLSVE